LMTTYSSLPNYNVKSCLHTLVKFYEGLMNWEWETCGRQKGTKLDTKKCCYFLLLFSLI